MRLTTKEFFYVAQKTFKVTASSGLHARPTTILVNTVSAFQADVQLQYGEKTVNLKSILGVLSLGIQENDEITIIATGADEEAVIEKLTETFKTEGLGE